MRVLHKEGPIINKLCVTTGYGMSQIVFTFFGRNQLNVKLTEKPKPKRMRMMIETLTESRSATQAKVKWVAWAQTYWLSIKNKSRFLDYSF